MRSDPAELVAKVARWRDFDQWRHTGELHYRAMPKRWLVEEFVPSDREKLEFKFFCLQGEPVFVSVITGRSAEGARRAVYDLAGTGSSSHTPGPSRSRARCRARPISTACSPRRGGCRRTSCTCGSIS